MKSKKMFKRFLSIGLSFCMLTTMLPVIASENKMAAEEKILDVTENRNGNKKDLPAEVESGNTFESNTFDGPEDVKESEEETFDAAANEDSANSVTEEGNWLYESETLQQSIDMGNILLANGSYAEYNQQDVAVIASMFENNNLTEGSKDAPTSWLFVRWDDSIPKRIQKLSLSHARLTGALDLSKLSYLEELDCSSNKLTELNVRNLSNLTYLECNENKLTELNVRNLSNLTYLECDGNKLTELNVKGLEELTNLSCRKNNLTILDISDLTNLTELDCGRNNLTGLDVSGKEELEKLVCDKNELTELDLSDLPNLYSCICRDNTISFLKLEEGKTMELSAVNGAVDIIEVDCGSGTVDLGAVPITYSYTFDKWLGVPEGESEDNPIQLSFEGDMIIEALFKPNTNIEYDMEDVAVIAAMFENNNLKSGKASNPSSWTFAEWNDSVPKRVETLSLQEEGLIGTLDVRGLEKLSGLYCSYNNLTGVAVSNLPNLESLYCSGNELGKLELSGLAALTALGCDNNELTELDTSHLTNLVEFDCSNNKLTELDTSHLTNLVEFDCSNNKLTTIDLSGVTNPENIELLKFYDNPLTFFKLQLQEGKTLSVRAAGGTVEWGNFNDYESTASLTAVPDTENGYVFTGWDGFPYGQTAANPVRFIWDGEITVEAKFEPDVKGGYSTEDVAVVRDIYKNNGLTIGKEDDPSTWTFAQWDNGSPKRIIGLEFFMGRISGNLDVRGLKNLTYLQCSENGLQTLNIKGLKNLTHLICYNNNITELDVSSLENLVYLNCHRCPLKTLNIGKLQKLAYLSCGYDSLTELDVSNLPSLKVLHCNGNPRLSDFKLKDGQSLKLTVSPGGIASVADFRWDTNEVRLHAYPDNECTFAKWTGLPTGDSTEDDVIFTLDRDFTVEAIFNIPNLVPVKDITGVPVGATAGKDLTLTGTVVPSTATNQNIVWKVKDSGKTGAVITGNVLKTKSAGTVTVRAVIAQGKASAFTKDFIIAVKSGASAEQQKQYRVNYKANAPASVKAAGIPSDTSVYKSGSMVTVKNAPSSPVRLFTGWNTRADGKGTAYSVGKTFKITGDVTLYAQWKSSFTASNKLKYKPNGRGTLTCTGTGNKKAKTIKIPATVKYCGVTYKVTGIMNKAFYKNKKITSISIGNNIKSIGNNAFGRCQNLKKAVIGTGVTVIGKYAFSYTKKGCVVMVNGKKLKSVKAGMNKGVKNMVIKVPKNKLSGYKKMFRKTAKGAKVTG